MRIFTNKRIAVATVIYLVILHTLPGQKAAFMAEFWTSPLKIVALNLLFYYVVIGIVVKVFRWIFT